MSNYLVRITQGKSNFEELRIHKKFSRRLVDLSENVNKVLLWRQVRKTKAKSLHIFKNTNNNNRRSAIIYFKNEKDLVNSSKFAMSYYNSKLNWGQEVSQENRSNNRQKMQIEREIQDK